MGMEGSIQIDLSYKNQAVSDVRIHSSRPLQAAAIFNNKPPEETLDLLPLLFSVCGTAQACAGVRACENALGLEVSEQTEVARDLLVWVETAKEHLLRLLLDWPGFVDWTINKSQAIAANALLANFKKAFEASDIFKLDAVVEWDMSLLNEQIDQLEALIEVSVLGDKNEWHLIRTESQLSQWITRTNTVASALIDSTLTQGNASQGQSGVGCLPTIDGLSLNEKLKALNAVAFIAAPTWENKVFETSPFSRQRNEPLLHNIVNKYGNGLLARQLARMVELANIPKKLRELTTGSYRQDAFHVKVEGVGLACVEAARGRLFHRLEMSAGKVSRYQIVAPTEWNFHPEGVLAQGLANLKAETSEELERLAGLLVNAIDPCVGFTVKVH